MLLHWAAVVAGVVPAWEQVRRMVEPLVLWLVLVDYYTGFARPGSSGSSGSPGSPGILADILLRLVFFVVLQTSSLALHSGLLCWPVLAVCLLQLCSVAAVAVARVSNWSCP